ncbi:MAG: hypothetical protein Aurels2KO_54750 [Aureliella sp.]
MSPFDPSYEEVLVKAEPQLRSLANQIPASVSAVMNGFGLVFAPKTRQDAGTQWLGHACRIGLQGSFSCCLEIHATPHVCAELFRCAIGAEPSNQCELDEMLCEVANQILGYAKAQVDVGGSRLMLPAVISSPESLGFQMAPINVYEYGDNELRVCLYPECR